jgi:urease accessory protein
MSMGQGSMSERLPLCEARRARRAHLRLKGKAVADGALSPPPSPHLRESWGGGARNEAPERINSAPPAAGNTPSQKHPASVGGGENQLDSAALYRLMSWLTPAYPVGAYAYSGGIEWAVEAGDVRDTETLRSWLTTMIRHGSVSCDAVIFANAHRAVANVDNKAIATIAELAVALAGSKERFLESTSQGQAFMQITQAAWPTPALDRLVAVWDGPFAFPVVVAAACAGHEIAVVPALQALLHAAASNLISASMRLVPLGQTDGQRVLAALEGVIVQTGERALATGIDDIATATLRADMAGMRHETQHTRLFRS